MLRAASRRLSPPLPGDAGRRGALALRSLLTQLYSFISLTTRGTQLELAVKLRQYGPGVILASYIKIPFFSVLQLRLFHFNTSRSPSDDLE